MREYTEIGHNHLFKILLVINFQLQSKYIRLHRFRHEMKNKTRNNIFSENPNCSELFVEVTEELRRFTIYVYHCLHMNSPDAHTLDQKFNLLP
jgi:hypothetical protein